MTDLEEFPHSMTHPPTRPSHRQLTTEFDDRCIGCGSIFTSTWGNRTGFCSSSCILATWTIRESEYTSPCWRGNRIRWAIMTKENPTREGDWIAFTFTPEDRVSTVLGIWIGMGQFAGAGKSEVDAVLDLIESIEMGGGKS